MIFANLELSKRLEAAEAFACAEYAAARVRVHPGSTSAWMKCAGATVVFDGIDAPTTQTFGLGLFEELTAAALDEIERFFLDRGAEPMHEVCPFAGTATLDLLCSRGYRPFEISNVMYRAVEKNSEQLAPNIKVRTVAHDEARLWSGISARGWAHEHPELEGFLRDLGEVCV